VPARRALVVLVRPACSLLACFFPRPLPWFHSTFLLVLPRCHPCDSEVGCEGLAGLRGTGEKHETELYRCRRRRRDHEGLGAIGWDHGTDDGSDLEGKSGLTASAPQPIRTDFYIILCMSRSARFFPLYLIFLRPSIFYIILYPLYPLWDPLITLSKYINV
jgi:hypothetical protein